ncbi:MAG: N-acetylmuramoyl-L-alanine amidase [Bacteroidales bacterium]|nr:N-acetylmuramoyl-L-alanine amidase [Bacteroidales bacterium]
MTVRHSPSATAGLRLGILVNVKARISVGILDKRQDMLEQFFLGLCLFAGSARGLDATLLVPEPTDIPLPERCRRVNEWYRQLGKDNVLLISIHCNAAGPGKDWTTARGWCAYTTRGGTRADALATSLYTAARHHLPGHRLRTDYTDAAPDLEKDFYLLHHTLTPAVLVENLFYDNPSDCAFLLSPEGQQAIVDLHVDGITTYLSTL